MILVGIEAMNQQNDVFPLTIIIVIGVLAPLLKLDRSTLEPGPTTAYPLNQAGTGLMPEVFQIIRSGRVIIHNRVPSIK